jgi:DNA mismatch repair protein MutL
MQHTDSINPSRSGPSSKRIQRLPPHVAERIAAGEVIERPASVVKELIENSIDSGATEIEVRLEQGGKSLIEILDNGHGIPAEDLALSIERHATSKLTTLADLERILTLGFRGEALASIAAVTDLQLVSRTPTMQTAYEFSAGDLLSRHEEKPQAKPIAFGHFLHSPHGTRIQARGLFSQIPARLKFLKSQSSEVSQIREWMERLAIAHPEIGFQLVNEGRTVLRLPVSTISGESDRIQQILSDGNTYPLLTVNSETHPLVNPELKIKLHWLQGYSSAQSRKLIQIVNGRAVRDRVLQQAILAPFRQLLMPGQFPAVVLILDIQPDLIDVNVHPAKTEVRFLDSKAIFSGVHSLIKQLVSKNGSPAFASPEMSSLFTSPGTSAFQFQETDPTPKPAPETQQWLQQTPHQMTQHVPVASLFKASETQIQREPLQRLYESPPLVDHKEEKRPKPHPLGHTRYLGALFETYLLFETQREPRGEGQNQGIRELILIDQHAADERIRYERLKQRAFAQPNDMAYRSQKLLFPEVVRFNHESLATIQTRLHWLKALGFETELFGEDSLVFRAIPTEWGQRQLSIRLKNLVDRLETAELPNNLANNLASESMIDEQLFESLAREACHSAVRAGDSLEPIESQELFRKLFECEQPWNCPHGRPTVVKIPQGKLEEWFQRKV